VRRLRAQAWQALLLAAAALLIALTPAVRAHDVAGDLRIHAFVRPDVDRLQVVLRVPLELLLNVDLPKRGNGYLDLARVEEAFPRALQATAKDIEFFEDGRRLTPVRGDARIALPSDRSFESFERAVASVRGVPLAVATDVYWNQGYFDAVLEYPIRSAASSIAVDFHVAPGLRDRLRLDLRYLAPGGDDVRAFELATGNGRVALDPRWFHAASTFVRSGFVHILGGADHLLFLLCLVVPFRRFGWTLVGVVTAFTVAHSVTLASAAYGVVPRGAWFPPLVETLIAASILYMAVENVLRPHLRWRWVLAGLFGLVHGFGFSFGLANELQFAGSHLVLSLLAFNVGIELGQLLVVAIAWPLLAWLLRHMERAERVVVAVISGFVAHAAWHWMAERFDELGRADWTEALALAPVASGVLLIVAAAFVAKGLSRRRGPQNGRRRAPLAG
jgi:hypothetical protein